MHGPPNSSTQSSANQARFQKNFSSPLAAGTTISFQRSRGASDCDVVDMGKLRSVFGLRKQTVLPMATVPACVTCGHGRGSTYAEGEPAAWATGWPLGASGQAVGKRANGSRRGRYGPNVANVARKGEQSQDGEENNRKNSNSSRYSNPDPLSPDQSGILRLLFFFYFARAGILRVSTGGR